MKMWLWDCLWDWLCAKWGWVLSVCLCTVLTSAAAYYHELVGSVAVYQGLYKCFQAVLSARFPFNSFCMSMVDFHVACTLS